MDRRQPRRTSGEIFEASLVVHGTADAFCPPAPPQNGSRPGRDIKLVSVKDGRHAITWTRPDEVNKALLEFLAD